VKLLIATHNPGKIREMNEILTGLGVECLDLGQAGITEDVEETGATFAENAILKAEYYAAATQLLTLGDDSGLEVDALHGVPGVYSKRYGGDEKPLYTRLMREIQDVPWEQRTARFRCVVALADGQGLIGTAEGKCEGMIALAPKGTGGFGYDPVFYIPDKDQTMAELAAEEKNVISHRGRAIAEILPLLRETLRR